MAHVILFTDRAPQARTFNSLKFDSAYYSYPAGAYKIASVLRKHGLKVIVVSNCLYLSLEGVKTIIKNNSKDLLWVGISTSFLTMKSDRFLDYRNLWHSSSDEIIGVDCLFNINQSFLGSTEVVWANNEINAISSYCKKNYDCPVLLGGAWVTHIKKGNLHELDQNIHIVTGNAERSLEKFTLSKLTNRSIKVPYIWSNEDYDQFEFKSSTIQWQEEDLIDSRAWLPLEVARGCAFNCAYCTYEHKGSFDAYKNPKVLREELIRNYELFGVTKYFLVDDLYNDSKDKVRILYDQVWSKLPFSPEWASYMRLDMIWNDPDSAEILKASGAKIGSFGIETLHDVAGRKVGKGLGKTRILETLAHLKEVWQDDVLVHGFFIAGLPFEPIESIKESIEWSLHTDLLFSYNWSPLWITPPDHFKIIEDVTLHKISKENDLFGVTWPKPNIWQNSVGVRFDEAEQIANEAMSKSPMGMRLSYSNYADIRTAGLSHQDIVGLKKGTTSQQILIDGVSNIRQMIVDKLVKVLNLHD
jgi:Radical SAM superfamily